MNLKNLVPRVLGATRRARALAEPSIALATRLVLGSAFYTAGTGKLAHFDATARYFAGLGLPAPEVNAAFVAGVETIGGIALLLGCATRVFSLLLSSTMVVALMTAHAGDVTAALTPGADGSLTDIVAFVYLMFLAWLAVHGAGAASFDGWFGPRVLRAVDGTVKDGATSPRDPGHGEAARFGAPVGR